MSAPALSQAAPQSCQVTVRELLKVMGVFRETMKGSWRWPVEGHVCKDLYACVVVWKRALA